MTLALHGKSRNRQWLLVAFALLAVLGAMLSAVAVQRHAFADTVTWDGNGTNADGTCKTFLTETDLEPGPGEQGWQFNMTQPEGDGPWYLTADFSPSGDVTDQVHSVASGGVVKWFIYTPIGATLISASAYEGDSDGQRSDSVLTISHCESGGGEPPQDTLNVFKSADTTFTRTHKWSIDKSVDTENHSTHNDLPKVWLYTDGSGDETATWTVDVTYEGYDDSDFVIYGDITIENPNDDPVTISSVVDDLGLTGYEDIALTCVDEADDPVTFPASLASLAAITCTYSESFGDTKPADNGTNTVTVTWLDSAGEAAEPTGDTDGWAFTNPTTEVDETVNVEDISDLFGTVDLGSVTAPNDRTFTYTKDFAWADYGADGCGDFSYDNTATIVETGASASATLLVNVQCYIYETAFAKSGAGTCFIGDGFDRWGWTNPYQVGVTGTVTWDLWAAAGQCDTSKGTLVGSVTVSSSGGYVTVEFNVDAPYLLDETHVYVGTTKYPKDKKGKSTVAPGQYTNNSPFANTTNVWVIAHAVVGLPDPNFGP